MIPKVPRHRSRRRPPRARACPMLRPSQDGGESTVPGVTRGSDAPRRLEAAGGPARPRAPGLPRTLRPGRPWGPRGPPAPGSTRGSRTTRSGSSWLSITPPTPTAPAPTATAAAAVAASWPPVSPPASFAIAPNIAGSPQADRRARSHSIGASICIPVDRRRRPVDSEARRVDLLAARRPPPRAVRTLPADVLVSRRAAPRSPPRPSAMPGRAGRADSPGRA